MFNGGQYVRSIDLSTYRSCLILEVGQGPLSTTLLAISTLSACHALATVRSIVRRNVDSPNKETSLYNQTQIYLFIDLSPIIIISIPNGINIGPSSRMSSRYVIRQSGIRSGFISSAMLRSQSEERSQTVTSKTQLQAL
jgi:hypothetical protein